MKLSALRTIRLALLLALSALPAAQAQMEAFTAPVQEGFAAYKAALLAKDGAKAVTLLSANSFAYYDRMRKLALSGSREEIERLPDVDRLLTLSLRVRVPRETLESGSARDIVAYAIGAGMISANSVAKAELGEINIKDDQAEGQILVNQSPVGAVFRFHSEDGVWKFDLEHVTVLARGTVAAMAEKNGTSENEVILQFLSKMTGKTIGPEIWQPLRPAQ
ncbi:MAG TPA: hypothetical protein VMW27_23995 [Thermoanaerobaculia bacterium]|nr:hypothetical protein [Thermoanaerobaculia bacterium]